MISLLYIFIDLYMIHHHETRLSWLFVKDQISNPEQIPRIQLSHPYNLALMREKQWDNFQLFLSSYNVPPAILNLVYEAATWEFTSDPTFSINIT